MVCQSGRQHIASSLPFRPLRSLPLSALRDTSFSELSADTSIDGETSCLTLGDVVKLKAEDAEDAKQIARLLPAIGGQASGDAREDAREVGGRIIELVATLGLRQTLTGKGVGKDQVPIIVGRATGGMIEGPMYDAVTHLVEGLY